MMIVGAERDRRLAELGLRAPVLRLTRGEEVHPALTPWCRKLAFSMEPEDFAPAGLEVVPLWEGENSITGFFVNAAGERVFIRYDVEHIDDYTEVGTDIAAALADVIDEYVEEEDIDEVVDALGYSREELMG